MCMETILVISYMHVFIYYQEGDDETIGESLKVRFIIAIRIYNQCIVVIKDTPFLLK